MFKWYAEFFKLTEKQMTRKALNRLKLFTLIALPVGPLMALELFGEFNARSSAVKMAALLTCYAAFVIVSCSKFANRFWVPNKYLDEWEIARKQQAMAFGYQCLTFTAAIAMGFFLLFDIKGLKSGIDVGVLSYTQLGAVLVLPFITFLYIVHIYLLLTVKPIDEIPDGDASVTPQ